MRLIIDISLLDTGYARVLRLLILYDSFWIQSKQFAFLFGLQ